MTTRWRLLLSPPLPGLTNMAVDEALLQSIGQAGRPTVRVYSWEDTCISLGRFQEEEEILNRALCASRGVSVVRRPTGGRAVLHHPGEVTYGIAAPVNVPHLGADVMASYRSVNNALVRGLGLLGVNAGTRERPPIWPDTGVGFGCFEAAYRHEVYWAGRKIVASAQRRRGGSLLQQGTIPGEKTGADLASFLRLSPGQRVTLTRELEERTGTLARALDRLPSLSEAATALAQGFQQAWEIDLVPEDLTAQEEAWTREIEDRLSSHQSPVRP